MESWVEGKRIGDLRLLRPSKEGPEAPIEDGSAREDLESTASQEEVRTSGFRVPAMVFATVTFESYRQLLNTLPIVNVNAKS